VVGALYLDSGLGAVEVFIHPLLEGARESILNELHDPKSHLQEWAQSQKIGTPHYKTVSATGPDHAKIFEIEVQIGDKVYGIGSGSSKQTAEHAAAQDALLNLNMTGN
jgi:ribonuclease-3